jgi:methylated-DNA-protein-cysteine methyltransferase related protein
VAVGSKRIVVADSHRMDSIVKRGRIKPKPKSQLKQKQRTVKRPLAKRDRDFPLSQGEADQSSKVRLQIEAVIRSIPRSKVSTYGAVARAAGLPRGARLVARILHRGFGLPWQRVLGAGGEIKLRGDHAVEQRLRLEAEGVRFRGRKVDMKQCEFKFGESRAANRKP